MRGDCSLGKSSGAVSGLNDKTTKELYQLPLLCEWLPGACTGLVRVLTIILFKVIYTVSLLLPPSEEVTN